MSDFYWPSLLEPASSRLEILSSAGRFSSPTSGYTRTISRPGERMRLTLSFENTNGAMRAALQSYLAGMRGAVHRVLAHDHSNRVRGSFPATELFSNNTFANGTTGWTANQSTLTVVDRVMRVTVVKNIAATAASFSTTPTVTPYVPYVLRSILGNRSRTGLSAGTYTGGVPNYSTDAQGLITQMVVPLSSSLGATYPVVYDANENVVLSGDWIECPWCSLSRCALVDNGANLLLQSDDFTTTWANTRSSDAANSTTDPLGTSTADSIIEDATASNTHYISQGVTVASTTNLDYAFTVCLKAGTRSFAQIAMVESTSSHSCVVDVNLSSGAIGTPAVDGANWTNPRAYIRNMGDGWYAVTIIGRKASAGTTLTARIYLASALGTISYTGDGASLIYAWRGTLAQSSVPTRMVATTTTAVSATSQALGGGLHTKGWPASTNGLLLPGDQVQIGSQLLIVTASLDSNAAGLGFLQFAPALRAAASDNAPVVVCQPMGKFFLESDANGWGNKPGIFSDAEVVLAEAA